MVGTTPRFQMVWIQLTAKSTSIFKAGHVTSSGQSVYPIFLSTVISLGVDLRLKSIYYDLTLVLSCELLGVSFLFTEVNKVIDCKSEVAGDHLCQQIA